MTKRTPKRTSRVYRNPQQKTKKKTLKKKSKKFVRKTHNKTLRKQSRKTFRKQSRKSLRKHSRLYTKKYKRTKKRKHKKIMRGGNFKWLLLGAVYGRSNFRGGADDPEGVKVFTTLFGDPWYNIEAVNSFIRGNMPEGIAPKDKVSSFKEIIIAGFTDVMRDAINGIIKFLNLYAVNISNGRGWRWYVVAAGGDGFNRLDGMDSSLRSVSPDIDVKVTFDQVDNPITSQDDFDNPQMQYAYNNFVYETYIRYLIVSTELSEALNYVCEKINQSIYKNNAIHTVLPTTADGSPIIDTGLDKFGNSFNEWIRYCQKQGTEDVNFLNPFIENIEGFSKVFEDYLDLFNFVKIPPRLVKRLSFIDAGINNGVLVFNNISLYALDLKFGSIPPFTGFGGILDLVLTIPEQLGYLKTSPGSDDFILKTVDHEGELYQISDKYYLHDMEILLLFELRIANYKIIKDIDRLASWLKMPRENMLEDVLKQKLEHILIKIGNICDRILTPGPQQLVGGGGIIVYPSDKIKLLWASKFKLINALKENPNGLIDPGSPVEVALKPHIVSPEHINLPLDVDPVVGSGTLDFNPLDAYEFYSTYMRDNVGHKVPGAGAVPVADAVAGAVAGAVPGAVAGAVAGAVPVPVAGADEPEEEVNIRRTRSKGTDGEPNQPGVFPLDDDHKYVPNIDYHEFCTKAKGLKRINFYDLFMSYIDKNPTVYDDSQRSEYDEEALDASEHFSRVKPLDARDGKWKMLWLMFWYNNKWGVRIDDNGIQIPCPSDLPTEGVHSHPNGPNWFAETMEKYQKAAKRNDQGEITDDQIAATELIASQYVDSNRTVMSTPPLWPYEGDASNPFIHYTAGLEGAIFEERHERVRATMGLQLETAIASKNPVDIAAAEKAFEDISNIEHGKPIFRTNILMTDPVQQMLCIVIMMFTLECINENPDLIPYMCNFRYPLPPGGQALHFGVAGDGVGSNDDVVNQGAGVRPDDISMIAKYMTKSSLMHCNPDNIDKDIEDRDKKYLGNRGSGENKTIVLKARAVWHLKPTADGGFKFDANAGIKDRDVVDDVLLLGVDGTDIAGLSAEDVKQVLNPPRAPGDPPKKTLTLKIIGGDIHTGKTHKEKTVYCLNKLILSLFKYLYHDLSQHAGDPIPPNYDGEERARRIGLCDAIVTCVNEACPPPPQIGLGEYTEPIKSAKDLKKADDKRAKKTYLGYLYKIYTEGADFKLILSHEELSRITD